MYIVQGDHGIPIPFKVQKISASENIEGATVEVAIHRGEDVFTKAATIINAAKGECEFVLTSADLTLFAKYEWQWTAYFPDGRIFSGKKREFFVSERLMAGSAGGETVPVIVPFATVEELEALDERVSTIETEGTGGGSGALVFNTLADLQTAYPNGTTQPAWIVADNAWYYWSGAIVTDTTAPVLTITSGGTFTGTKSVTMSVNETADIYYTLDGSTPTTSSAKYTSPLSISATTTLKAFAKDTAGNSSAVQTVTYTLDATPPADTTAPTNVTNLTYSNLAQTSLTLNWTASASSDVASYDVYNGATLLANVTGTTYNVSSLIASTQYTFTVKAKDAANNVASGTSITVTTSAPADTTAPVVTASPAAGTYTSAQSITLTANETATIYYTTNGTTPTTASTVYTGPISISTSTTLQFIARDTAGNTSTPVAATYTINIPDTTAPVLTITPAATFTDTQTVSMSANETATIYYTIDGSAPTTSSNVYSTPLSLNATTTVKAFAKDTAGNSSAIQTVTYTKNMPTLIVNDTFDRADDATTLGIATSGQAWVPLVGTWGTISNQVYSPGAAASPASLAYIDCGKSDATIELTQTTAQPVRLAFRIVDNQQYFNVQTGGAGSVYTCYKWNTGGGFTKMGDTTQTHAVNNVLKVVLTGSNVKIYVNDVLGLEFTNTGYQTSTKHGIQATLSGARGDNFKITG